MPSTDWPNWIDWDVWVHDGCRCVYCGLDGTDWHVWFQPTIDHIIPRSIGLTDQRLKIESRLNKAVACCNLTKGAYDPRENETAELTETYRLILIDRVKNFIRTKQEQTYRKAFTAIMSDIFVGVKSLAGMGECVP